jgi:predicted permease
MKDIWPIVSSVIGVFLVIMIGVFCRHRHWLSQSADRSLASLAANVLMPALFVDRILSGSPLADPSVAWMPPVFGFVLTASGFLIGLAIAKTIGPAIGLNSDIKQRSFALCVGICNYGYIPLPLAEQFYPQAVVELILHNVGVELALWSVGIAVVGGGSGSTWRRALLNPPLLAVVVSLLCKQLVPAGALPSPLLKVAAMLGNCAIPMGLLLSGALIVDYLREADWRGSTRIILAAIGVRQVIMPTLMLAAASAVTISTDLSQVMMLEAAMPAAVFPIVLVRLYERDTDTALRVVLSTSLAAIVLIPFWLAVGKWWLGV